LKYLIDYVKKDINRYEEFTILCNNVDFKKIEKKTLVSYLSKNKWLQKCKVFLNEIVLKDISDDEEEGEEEVDEEKVQRLLDMGFRLKACIKALKKNEENVETSIDWLFQHNSDSEFDDSGLENELIVEEVVTIDDEDKLKTVMEMGFSKNASIKALFLNGEELDRAVNWLFEHSEDKDINDEMKIKKKKY
jgi:uncharacterized UBP type Zn finger protein